LPDLAEGGALLMRRVLRNQLVRHGAIVFTSTCLVNGLNYLFHLAAARRLGVDDYGDLASLIAVLMVTLVPASILTMIVVKLSAELYAVDDIPRLRALCDLVLRSGAYASAGILGVGVLLTPLIAGFLQLSHPASLVMVLLVLCATILLFGVRGILQGVQDFRRYAISSLVEAGLKALLGIGLVYAGFGAFGAMLGYAIATFTALAYTLYAVRRHFTDQRLPVLLDVRRLVQTSGGVTFSMLALTTLSFSDVLLVKHFFGATDAGLFGAVSLSGKVLLFTSSFVPTILLPKAVDKASRGESPNVLLLQSVVATAALAALVLAAFYAVPTLVVRALAGPAFVAAAPYLFPYGMAMTFLGTTTLIATYKIGLHRYDFAAPLAAICVGEIFVIALRHATLGQVISVLLVGHGAALLAAIRGTTVQHKPNTTQRSVRNVA
jgi:O-antigen/teichoic acid export membrane protein